MVMVRMMIMIMVRMMMVMVRIMIIMVVVMMGTWSGCQGDSSKIVVGYTCQ